MSNKSNIDINLFSKEVYFTVKTTIGNGWNNRVCHFEKGKGYIRKYTENKYVLFYENYFLELF
ncbi:hypothetical protein, partial [Treponema sp. R80B11-R83G3]